MQSNADLEIRLITCWVDNMFTLKLFEFPKQLQWLFVWHNLLWYHIFLKQCLRAKHPIFSTALQTFVWKNELASWYDRHMEV